MDASRRWIDWNNNGAGDRVVPSGAEPGPDAAARRNFRVLRAFEGRTAGRQPATAGKMDAAVLPVSRRDSNASVRVDV
jgi:hypothetical protein